MKKDVKIYKGFFFHVQSSHSCGFKKPFFLPTTPVQSGSIKYHLKEKQATNSKHLISLFSSRHATCEFIIQIFMYVFK